MSYPPNDPPSDPSRDAAHRESRRPVQPLHSRYFPTLLVIFVVLLAMLAVPPFLERISYYSARGRQRAAREALDEITPTAFSATSRLVADAVQDSVVHVTTRTIGNGRSPFGASDFGLGQGSGVIVHEDGYVLTNFHVIAGASEITVQLSDHRELPAEVIGFDEYSDLAVLKIAGEAFVPTKWGDSDALEAGDPVWAVGSPYGLDNTITFGILSAKGRDGIGHKRYEDLLQTDAAVNPGNSGGALVNARGELVGINTAIVGKTFSGISFAIPSKMARVVFEELKENQQVARGWLGVQPDKVSPEQAASLGMDNTRGASVVRVLHGSPAAAAGLEVGDVIVEWNGKAVNDPQQFSLLVKGTEPDANVTMIVVRAGKRVKLEVTVGRLKSLR